VAPERVLLVDDEPAVLAGLARILRGRYAVLTAESAAAGLDLLAAPDAEVAVVVSDMRMPRMDGAAFLARARHVSPRTVRLVLTGYAELGAAIAAVNDGQIFRFLTKPCPAPRLVAAVDDAVAQYRLLEAERELLEHTLRGSVAALTEVLALTSPLAFGRATRLRRLVSELAEHLGVAERWSVEVAAMLSQLGFVALGPETLTRLSVGDALEPGDEEMIARAATVTLKLLANIPRIEAVRAILARVNGLAPQLDAPLGAGARAAVDRGVEILRAARDFDDLEGRGRSARHAIDILESRAGCYAGDVLAALGALRASERPSERLLELPLASLRVGMRLAEDVRLQNGALLVARGGLVTESLLARMQNYKRGAVREPVRAFVDADEVGA
jgi:FixJ family two-component response regulator